MVEGNIGVPRRFNRNYANIKDLSDRSHYLAKVLKRANPLLSSTQPLITEFAKLHHNRQVAYNVLHTHGLLDDKIDAILDIGPFSRVKIFHTPMQDITISLKGLPQRKPDSITQREQKTEAQGGPRKTQKGPNPGTRPKP